MFCMQINELSMFTNEGGFFKALGRTDSRTDSRVASTPCEVSGTSTIFTDCADCWSSLDSSMVTPSLVRDAEESDMSQV